MKSLTHLFYRLFAGKETFPVPQEVQTALEPIHENNSYQGDEFLDDFLKMSEDEEK